MIAHCLWCLIAALKNGLHIWNRYRLKPGWVWDYWNSWICFCLWIRNCTSYSIWLNIGGGICRTQCIKRELCSVPYTGRGHNGHWAILKVSKTLHVRGLTWERFTCKLADFQHNSLLSHSALINLMSHTTDLTLAFATGCNLLHDLRLLICDLDSIISVNLHHKFWDVCLPARLPARCTEFWSPTTLRSEAENNAIDDERANWKQNLTGPKNWRRSPYNSYPCLMWLVCPFRAAHASSHCMRSCANYLCTS